jgi:hypothetical protein
MSRLKITKDKLKNNKGKNFNRICLITNNNTQRVMKEKNKI